MAKRGLIALATVTFVATAVNAAVGDVRRETTTRRPYIVEVGEPYSITQFTLARESDYITEMGDYIQDYGYPDYAEIQEIAPQWPWETYEVRLFYMRRNLEADFGHVDISPAMPDFGMLKYSGDISPEKKHQIEVILQARQAPPALPPVAEAPVPAPAPEQVATREEPKGGLTEALVARIEAAAERAAQAADRAAEQSEAAERAADRTVNIVDKIVESAGARHRR